MLQMIHVDKLFPHPDNPRKNLGDLTELAESIKASGVMQNLTVVPRIGKAGEPVEDAYTVIIGHRRLAASKLAGLTELPCAVREMSPREQIATMLLENMQRSDLTVYEQAQGFQMMLNLGESVTGISEKTGFSESTVRRRVKLLELDSEKFRKATERGATLMDFMELEKIQSPELRNKVLEAIGTKNFDYEMRQALDREKAEANREKWVEALSSFATEAEDTARMRQVAWHNLTDDPVKVLRVPEDAGETDYFFRLTSYSVTIVREAQNSADEDAQQAVYRAQNEREVELRAMSERAYQLRRAFIGNFPATKKHVPQIIRFWMRMKMLAVGDWCYFNTDAFAGFLELGDENGDYELDFETIEQDLKAAPERVFLYAAYADINDNSRNNYYQKSWQKWPEHAPNAKLDELYAALEELGYQMSDEERALQDGTHVLFRPGVADAGRESA